jgi:hypothetical protein
MENDTKAPEAPKEAASAEKPTADTPKQTTSKSNNNKVIVIVLVVVGVLVVMGIIGSLLMGRLFKNAGEKLVENATNTQISTNKDGTTTIKSNDGSTSVSTEQKLPDDFPKNIPLYSGQKITSSSKVKSDNETTWQVVGETKDSVSKAADGVKKLYSAWESTGEQQLNDTYYYYYTKGNTKANVYVANNGDGNTIITYSITESSSTE